MMALRSIGVVLALLSNLPIAKGDASQLQLTFNTLARHELSALSSSEFISFNHPAFPAHGLRIKKTVGFCDPTVNTYTGYLDTNYSTKHLFFYFFESRNHPKTDDVVMWVNGGPGGASEIGAFMELGEWEAKCNTHANSFELLLFSL